MGRRATVPEVAMLDLLNTVPLDLVEERPTASQILGQIDLRLQAIDDEARKAGRPTPGYVVENRIPEGLSERPVFIARDATLAAAAEAIALQTASTWYPSDRKLVVLPKEQWVLEMLEKPVSLAYDTVELQQVIDDLERMAGLPFRIEPGALAKVEKRFQKVRLFLEDKTVRQALESIGGVSGLAWEVDGDGIYLWHVDGDGDQRRPRTPLLGFRNTEQPVLLVDLGDGTSLLVYESELPREARERLERRRREAVDAIVRDRPTTQPAD